MTDDSLPDNVLFDLYEQYIGEPDARTDVYLGFGLFFAGVALASVGLVLFLLGGQYEYGTGAYWAWLGPAYSLGMMSLPTTLLGVIVLLPVDNRAIYSGAAGTAVTYLSVVAFAIVYPANWNTVGTDYSGPVVVLYGLGLAAVLASTGAALVAHQIERHTPGPADIEPVEEPEPDPEETYSEEEIREDIEQAMDEVDITWGGVEKHEGTALELDVDSDIDTSGMDVEATKVTRSSNTDAQVQGLKALKGGEKNTATSESTVDDQTSKLTELRQRRREEEESAEAEAAASSSDAGFLKKILQAIGMK